ncbi:TPA: YkgJ family cysteine cluster protein [Serratia marcescens]
MSCNSDQLSFPCSKCGLCCQQVNLAKETLFLDRGDGTCRYYDPASKGCRIYNERPDICRVDLQFALHYSHLYTWENFVELNLVVCRQLIEADESK